MSDTSRRLQKAVQLAPWVLALLFLLPNYAFFHDNLVYANQVSFKPWIQKLHPHHLGYNTFIWLLWTLSGKAISPLVLMVGLGRLAGIASLFTLRTLGEQLRLNTQGQLWLLLFYAFAYGVWFHATAGAAYVPATWCVLMALSALLRWPNAEGTDRPLASGARWMLAGILLHQLAVLALVPTLAWVWQQGGNDRVKRARTIVVSWFGPAVACYVAVFVLVHRSLNPIALWVWATRYAHEGTWWWWEKSERTGLQAWFRTNVTTQARVLWATPFDQHLPPISTEPFAMAFQVAWPPERYYLLCGWLGVVLPLVALVVLVPWMRRDPANRTQALWLLSWCIPFALLSAVFDPLNAGFRLYFYAPLLVLLLHPLTEDPPPLVHLISLPLVPLLLALTLATNYAYGWQPLSQPLVNPYYDELSQVRDLPAGPIFMGGAQDPDWLATQYLFQFLARPVYESQFWTAADYAAHGSPATRPPAESLYLPDWMLERYQQAPPQERPRYLVGKPPNPTQPPTLIDLTQWQPVTGWDRGELLFVEFQPRP